MDEIYDDLNKFRNRLNREYDINKTESGRFTYYILLREVVENNDLDVSDYQYRSDINERDIDFSKNIDLYNEIKSDPTILDRIYSSIISDQDYLRSQGQFFTPKNISDFMSSIEGLESSENVLDPACGPGVFLDSVDKCIEPSNITAIDKDPLLLYAAEIRSTINGYSDKAGFYSADFIKNKRNKDKYDLIIGNPPYNKFQNYKNDIGDILGVEDKYDLGKLANLYALFFVKSSQMIKEGGYVVLLTPSEYLHTDYGEPLKKLFKHIFSIDRIIKVDLDNSGFDAMTTLCITVLQKEESESNNVEFYRTDTENTILDNDGLTLTKSIPQSDVSVEDKWNQYFREINHQEYLEETVKLSSLAETKRGIATGYNDYFTFNRTENRDWNIEDRYLKPVLTNSKDAKNYIFMEEDFIQVQNNSRKCYLLYYQGEEVSEGLQEYIDHGVEIDADDRYITRNRNPWYSMESRDPAPILATVFSRDDMRFIYNKKEVLNLAAFHGVYPKKEDDDWIKAFLAYLNSDIALELAKTEHREYAEGLSKFEPGDLSDIPVLDLRELKQDEIEDLSEIFEKLNEYRRKGSKNETKIREQLNSKIVKLFEEYAD